MSPLAALVDAFFGPLLLAALLFCEWWANWFVLGRDFSRTGLITLVSNGCSHGAGQVLLRAGALGAVSGEAGAAAWVLAWCALYAAHLGIEAACIEQLMRRWRPRWRWDRYDLAVFCAAQGVGFLGLGVKAIWL